MSTETRSRPPRPVMQGGARAQGPRCPRGQGRIGTVLSASAAETCFLPVFNSAEEESERREVEQRGTQEAGDDRYWEGEGVGTGRELGPE